MDIVLACALSVLGGLLIKMAWDLLRREPKPLDTGTICRFGGPEAMSMLHEHMRRNEEKAMAEFRQLREKYDNEGKTFAVALAEFRATAKDVVRLLEEVRDAVRNR